MIQPNLDANNAAPGHHFDAVEASALPKGAGKIMILSLPRPRPIVQVPKPGGLVPFEKATNRMGARLAPAIRVTEGTWIRDWTGK
jgi:hypothetical protein